MAIARDLLLGVKAAWEKAQRRIGGTSQFCRTERELIVKKPGRTIKKRQVAWVGSAREGSQLAGCRDKTWSEQWAGRTVFALAPCMGMSRAKAREGHCNNQASEPPSRRGTWGCLAGAILSGCQEGHEASLGRGFDLTGFSEIRESVDFVESPRGTWGSFLSPVWESALLRAVLSTY